jgi:hypothetical protein
MRTNGLQLSVKSLRSVDDEDWVRVGVVASAPDFSAETEGWLQAGDITRFADECRALYDTVGKNGRAILQSAEPDIHVTLESNALAQITGQYPLESERPNGIQTVRRGSFEMDQSHLPELEKGSRRLATELAKLSGGL